MARTLIYQMFFQPTMLVLPIPAVSGIRRVRINVFYQTSFSINVAAPDPI